MADDERGEELPEAEDAEAAPPTRKRGGRRRLMLLAGLPVLLAAGAAGAYFGGLLDPGGGGDGGTEVAAVEQQPKVFFDMPEMLVNLAGRQEQRAQYLKLSVVLEMPDRQTQAALEPVLPRIVDLFQVYLRQLRAEDLEGSAGVYRLKEELIRRVDLEIAPRKIDDVLFKDIIIQ